MNLEELNQIKEKALAEANGAADAAALEEVRIKYLSRKGLLTDVMAQLKDGDYRAPVGYISTARDERLKHFEWGSMRLRMQAVATRSALRGIGLGHKCAELDFRMAVLVALRVTIGSKCQVGFHSAFVIG